MLAKLHSFIDATAAISSKHLIVTLAPLKRKGLTPWPDKCLKIRLEKSKPLLEEFKLWLDDKAHLVLPKSPIGKAIAYARTHWEGLMVFLNDGRLRPDNNHTENEIRPFVIARKNFLFSCTMAGADALGVHFSLLLTAKQHNLDPYKYYVKVIQDIPYCQSIEGYEALLPWNVKL